MKQLIGSLCVASGLLMATDAAAQAGKPLDHAPQFQFGSLTLEPAFSMQTGPNTNINKEVNGISDYETALIPHLDLTLETERGILRSFAAIEFARFQEHPIEDGHSTYTDVQWEGRNALFRPRFLFSRRNQGARASDFEEIGLKSRRLENTISPGLEYGLPGGRIQVGGTYTMLSTRYDAASLYEGSSLAEKLNFDRKTYSGDITIQLTPLAAVMVSSSWSQDSFLLTPQRDGTSSKTLVSMVFPPQANITGSLGIGIKHASAPDPGSEPFTGPVWIGQLRHVSSRGTEILLNLTRDTSYSYDVGHSYYIDTESRLSMMQPLRSGIELFGQIATLGISYQGSERGTEHGLAVGGGFRYKIRPWSTVGINIDRITRDGSAPWSAFRVMTFWAHGTRFMHLERTMPGDDYSK